MRARTIAILLLAPALLNSPVRAYPAAATYYVRPDGGSPAQCTGLANAPYTGASQDCAWDHPFRALPPEGTPRIAGGDTLVIAAGEYMMGYGAPGAEGRGVAPTGQASRMEFNAI